MAKRKIVFLAGLAAVITLLTWALLPYLFPLQLHTVDINLEYRNCLDFTVRTDVTNVRNLIPSSITVWPRGPTSWGVNFQIGLLHMEVEGRVTMPSP